MIASGDVLGLALVERNAFASLFDANSTMPPVTTVEHVSLTQRS